MLSVLDGSSKRLTRIDPHQPDLCTISRRLMFSFTSLCPLSLLSWSGATFRRHGTVPGVLALVGRAGAAKSRYLQQQRLFDIIYFIIACAVLTGVRCPRGRNAICKSLKLLGCHCRIVLPAIWLHVLYHIDPGMASPCIPDAYGRTQRYRPNPAHIVSSLEQRKTGGSCRVHGRALQAFLYSSRRPMMCSF